MSPGPRCRDAYRFRISITPPVYWFIICNFTVTTFGVRFSAHNAPIPGRCVREIVLMQHIASRRRRRSLRSRPRIIYQKFLLGIPLLSPHLRVAMSFRCEFGMRCKTARFCHRRTTPHDVAYRRRC